MTEPQLLEVLKKANDHYNVIYVGIGKLKFGTRHDVLKITALGSCVGLAIYPERFKGEPIGALAHIMLPSSRTRTTENNIGKAKYADTAIEHILKKYYELGYKPNELQAKATGGGNMYPKRLPQRQLDIGNQNIQEIKRLLKQHQIHRHLCLYLMYNKRQWSTKSLVLIA